MMRISIIIAVALAATGAHAEPANEVFALIVTNNHSAEIGRPDLHYADDDGAKYYDLFRMLASDDDVELLTELDRDSAQLFPEARAKALPPTKAQVTAAAARIAARVRRSTHATELYFVFAGHGDVDHGRGFLELRDGRLTSDDLEALLREIAPTHAHVILDSCNSFFVLNPRKPGGRQIAVTEQAAASIGARLPSVGVFLSTSAEAQVFEWSELQSGIFSHAVRSGLAGAADANHDGRITYDELRAFVEIATAKVKNPLYRPKVFARAPGGNNDAAIVELAGAHARKLEVPPGPMRLTVRDGDDLPWIDVHEEPGAATTLYLPTRWAASAMIDEHLEGGAIARHPMTPGDDAVRVADLAVQPAPNHPRGPNELLADLFGEPFGPHAYVAWRDETSHAPGAVFGVSSEDGERMRLLLGQVADEERGQRRLLSAVGLGMAATTAWAELHDPTIDRDVRNFGIASAAAFGVTCVWMLFSHSEGEKLYDDYVARMADPTADKARAVADTERRLNKLADRYRFRRRFFAVDSALLVALSVGLLIANEHVKETAQERTTFRLLGGEFATIGLGFFVWSLHESSIERLRALWMSDPGLSQMPRFSVGVVPTNGGGYLSFSARF